MSSQGILASRRKMRFNSTILIERMMIMKMKKMTKMRMMRYRW